MYKCVLYERHSNWKTDCFCLQQPYLLPVFPLSFFVSFAAYVYLYLQLYSWNISANSPVSVYPSNTHSLGHFKQSHFPWIQWTQNWGKFEEKGNTLPHTYTHIHFAESRRSSAYFHREVKTKAKKSIKNWYVFEKVQVEIGFCLLALFSPLRVLLYRHTHLFILLSLPLSFSHYNEHRPI